MTPEQRTALLDAIDVYGRTSRELMMASYEGRDAAEAQRLCNDAYRRVLALSDEATDYSTAEGVSEHDHGAGLRCIVCDDREAVSGQ